jgi:hypothetical protein
MSDDLKPKLQNMEHSVEGKMITLYIRECKNRTENDHLYNGIVCAPKEEID